MNLLSRLSSKTGWMISFLSMCSAIWWNFLLETGEVRRRSLSEWVREVVVSLRVWVSIDMKLIDYIGGV